jgi:hypothetical protein
MYSFYSCLPLFEFRAFLLEIIGPGVCARYIRDCSTKNACSSSENYPIRCASTANVVCRDAEVFGTKTVSFKVKVNLSLRFINEALYHNDICRSGGIAPPFLTLAPDGSGGLHAPGAGKSPLYSLDRRLVWLRLSLESMERKSCAYRESIIGRLARSLSLHRLS